MLDMPRAGLSLSHPISNVGLLMLKTAYIVLYVHHLKKRKNL